MIQMPRSLKLVFLILVSICLFACEKNNEPNKPEEESPIEGYGAPLMIETIGISLSSESQSSDDNYQYFLYGEIPPEGREFSISFPELRPTELPNVEIRLDKSPSSYRGFNFSYPMKEEIADIEWGEFRYDTGKTPYTAHFTIFANPEKAERLLTISFHYCNSSVYIYIYQLSEKEI